MRKLKPLVCQHLENVSRDLLEQNQEIVRQYVRHRQGVYALYRRGKIYYVGLAGNLRSRLAQLLGLGLVVLSAASALADVFARRESVQPSLYDN